MYTLFRGLWSYLTQKDQYSVLILGLDGAGKTTYLEQTKVNFVKDYRAIPHQNITTTVGLNIGDITIDGVKLKFWDLGGQEELQTLWDKGSFPVAEINKIFYDSMRFVGQRDCTIRGVSALKGISRSRGCCFHEKNEYKWHPVPVSRLEIKSQI